MSAHTSSNQVSLTLLLGGVRAGKSGKALQLARSYTASAQPGSVLFVATAQAFDAEMAQRINAHKLERPSHWLTLEEPVHIAGAIAQQLATHPHIAVVVIDCLTLWVSNILLSTAEGNDVEVVVARHTTELLSTIRPGFEAGAAKRHFIVVSNEVGLGIVPPTLLGRQYRDALGRANQLVAAAANDVTLMIAGLEMPLKTAGTL